MNREYAALYRDLYEHHWWWQAREAILVDEIARRAPTEGWGRILDVGCGDGLFFDRLRAFGDVRGVEPDASLISADSDDRDRIYVGAFNEGFNPGVPFGLVLLLDVLEHLDDPVVALKHAGALLAPGGRILVTVPAFQMLWTTHDDLNEHRRRYRRSSLAAAAQAAGLAMLSTRYLFQWLVPAKLLVRVAERAVGRESRLPTIPPDWLNGALLRLTRLEAASLGRLSVPFGSSLLAWYSLSDDVAGAAGA